jgi:hypothetical protein
MMAGCGGDWSDLLLGNRAHGEVAGWFDGIWTRGYDVGTYQSVPGRPPGLVCESERSGPGRLIVCAVDLVMNCRGLVEGPCQVVDALGVVHLAV